MCGLVGMAGDIPYNLRGLFRDFLDVAQVRGRDSTGVIRVDKNNAYTWLKQVGPPTYLCDSRHYEQRVERTECSVLIGHTRSKTVGDVSVKNSHPFDFPTEGICGVHNGTLTQHHRLDTHEYGKVDSEVLYGHLAKNGPEATFDRLTGAFACVWWNDKEKTVNFFRNKERPLFFTWTKDLRVILWASETWMFNAIRRKIELFEGTEEKPAIMELPTEVLWSFRIDTKAAKDKPVLTMSPIKEIKHNPPQVSSVWTERSPGSWHRGGEVTSPFVREDWIDDDLPFERGFFLNGVWQPGKERPSSVTPQEGTNSQPSEKTLLLPSKQLGAPSTDLRSSLTSKNNVLSLPSRTSPSSPSKSNDESCTTSGNSSGRRKLSLLNGVSFRNVLGEKYITNNATGEEYEEEVLLKNTGGCCCFCKDPIKSVADIATILNAEAFLCKDCVKEPVSNVA